MLPAAPLSRINSIFRPRTVASQYIAVVLGATWWANLALLATGFRRLFPASLRSFGEIWNNCPNVMFALCCCKSFTTLYGCICAAIDGWTVFFFLMITRFFFGIVIAGSVFFTSIAGAIFIVDGVGSSTVSIGVRTTVSLGSSNSVSFLS